MFLTIQTFRPACEVWKHAICYGFEDARDSSIPDVFVCYHCRAEKGLAEASLQPEKEAEITHALAELRSLTLFRRGAFCSTFDSVPFARTDRARPTAIDAVWHGGVMSTKDLGKYLGPFLSSRASYLRPPLRLICSPIAVDNATAGQVLKRLKAESFIVEQGASRKGKGKGGSQIGSLKAAPQVVNKSVASSVLRTFSEPPCS